jgi:hypothetical protein
MCLLLHWQTGLKSAVKQHQDKNELNNPEDKIFHLHWDPIHNLGNLVHGVLGVSCEPSQAHLNIWIG